MVRKSIGDAFIKKLVKEKYPVTIFLLYGVKLQGIIVGQDAQSILLRRDAHTQLIYKHAVSTIMPVEAISFLDNK